MSKIRIEADDERIGSDVKVYINDIPQDGLTAVEFRAAVGEIVQLRLDRFTQHVPFARRFSQVCAHFVREMRYAYRGHA